MARLLLTLVGLALIWPAETDARQKKPGPYDGTCSCTCASDEKNLSGLPKWSSSVSFSDTESECRKASGFGGCRTPKADGSYATGTLRHCTHQLAGDASRENGGVDPDEAPSTEPFKKPPKVFSQ